MAETPCSHALNDFSDLTDSTVVKNYRYGKETRILGYFCREHQSFGCWSYSGPLRRMAITNDPDGPPLPLDMT